MKVSYNFFLYFPSNWLFTVDWWEGHLQKIINTNDDTYNLLQKKKKEFVLRGCETTTGLQLSWLNSEFVVVKYLSLTMLSFYFSTEIQMLFFDLNFSWKQCLLITPFIKPAVLLFNGDYGVQRMGKLKICGRVYG